MAAESLYSTTNQILYNELKKRFQEVPELVIETIMIQNGYVREKCIDALGRESHRYLRKFDGDVPAMHDRFRSLQVSNISHLQQPHHSFPYDILPGNKIPQNSNNGLMYPHSSRFPDPLSAPIRPHDYEPFMGGAQSGQPTSIPCPAYPGPRHTTSSATNMVSHSISHPGMFPSDYNPYSNWSYSQQRMPARPGNFAQSFESSQTTNTTYSPINNSPQQQYAHGAYSPSHESYNPAGQVTNSPISSNRSPLPGSPATPPSQQPHSLPPNMAHIPASSSASVGSPQVSTPAQYPVQFHRSWTMNGPEAQLGAPADTQYEEALLHHQRERLQKLLQDLGQSKEALSRCKDRVTDMENKCLERRRRRRSNSFPSVEDVQKMRDENRKLRVEIGVLFTQIDGQTQLGSNPSQGQNFYSNIGKGQGGSIHGMNQQSEGGDYHGATNNQSRAPPRRPPRPNFLITERPPGSNPPSLGTPSPYTPPQNNPSPVTPPRHAASVSTPKHSNTVWFVPPSIPEQVAPHPTATTAAATTALTRQNDQGSMPPPRPPPPRSSTGTPSRVPAVSDREDRTSDDEEEKWNCSACTFLNHPSLDKCEVCEMPRITGNFFGSAVR